MSTARGLEDVIRNTVRQEKRKAQVFRKGRVTKLDKVSTRPYTATINGRRMPYMHDDIKLGQNVVYVEQDDPFALGQFVGGVNSPQLVGNTRTWVGIEEITTGTLPAGSVDGTPCFVRNASAWQSGQMRLFQMHANGNTYRFNGNTLETLDPGQYCHGPSGLYTYAGITSVLMRGTTMYGFVHNEEPQGAIHRGTISVWSSDEDGYTWSLVTDKAVEGQGALTAGFMGATMPSVVEETPGGDLRMFYTNRFGDGRHMETWVATATAPGGPWTVVGPAFPQTEDAPHFYAASPTVMWSTTNLEWLMTYQTDAAVQFRWSADLINWSDPQTLFEKPQQYLQSTGFWQWYPTFLDDSQDNANVVGDTAMMSEHWLTPVTGATRYPTLTNVTFV